MSLLHLLLLVVALLPLGQLLFRPRRAAGGPGRYARLLAASWLRFGLTSAVLLALLERWPAFRHLPPEFASAQALLGAAAFRDDERLVLIGAGAAGVSIGVLGGGLLTAWRAWHGRPEGTMFGDAGSVRPRGTHEIGWGAAVSATAGVTEEAYFRLLLPLLGTLASGDAVAAFAGAALLFGAAHRYQGWRGMVATALAGAALSAFYLASGSLLAAMAIHAAGDAGHLVLRPAVRGWIEGRKVR